MNASLSPNALNIHIENLAQWRGVDVIDEQSQKLGKLDDVLYDSESDDPAFGAVRSGTLSKHVTLLPLLGATVGRDYVRVRSTKGSFKDAPSFGPETQLTIDEEASVYQFFGLDYAPTAQGGRRLAKR
jgi:PRC-barrel domain